VEDTHEISTNAHVIHQPRAKRAQEKLLDVFGVKVRRDKLLVLISNLKMNAALLLRMRLFVKLKEENKLSLF